MFGLICQGVMLDSSDLMILSVALAGNGACLPVHLLVKVELILGYQMQVMLQVHHLVEVDRTPILFTQPHPGS